MVPCPPRFPRGHRTWWEELYQSTSGRARYGTTGALVRGDHRGVRYYMVDF